MAKDKIYSNPLSTVPAFTFGAKVTDVFDDMISRSVPLYQEVGQLSSSLAHTFAQPGSYIYDLGSSTGTTLLSLAQTITDPSVALVGLDSSPSMIQEARRRHLDLSPNRPVEFIDADISEFSYQRCSVVLANYTLQFLPPERRAEVIGRLYRALLSGGLFLVTEKIRHTHPQLQSVLTELHHDFKRKQGYSDLEIAQKRAAIENVLIPLTIEENQQILFDAGFSVVYPVLTWYNFVTLAAIKLED